MLSKLKFFMACVLAGFAVLIVLSINRFSWGKRFNEWVLKIP